MECPRCSFEHELQTTECLKCGIVFAKYRPRIDRIPDEPSLQEDSRERRQELLLRIFAFPAVLASARILVGAAPGIIRLLSMWVHECGHAMTAWLCGFWAMPGPWFTPVSDERSLAVTLLVLVCIGFWGFELWMNRQWLLFYAAGALLIAKIICTLLPLKTAQALIIFGGDGGCMVLGVILMMTFYARRESALYENSLRWGFLWIGALALMDAFHAWSGTEDDIPFGVQEGNLTDPSKLVQMYGWPIHVMTGRYLHLGMACFAALTVAYVAGIVSLTSAGAVYNRR